MRIVYSFPFFIVLICATLIHQTSAQFGYTRPKPNQGRNATTTTPSPPTSTQPARNNRTRIVGGIETVRNEYPFIVSLSRRSQHFCGGSIIGEAWIITAAHCVSHPDFEITAGEHDMRKMEGTEQFVRAEIVIRHPQYNPLTYEDDIAVVKVSPPFIFTPYVKAFNLPSVHFVATGNVTTAGWGVEAEGSNDVSPVLRKVTIELFSNIECSKMYGKEFHLQKMICAGQEEGGKDACQGDSGGPLLCDDHYDSDTLCGVVSFGFGCARSDFAGVYTKVAYYADWITWEQSRVNNPNNPNVWTTKKPGTRVPNVSPARPKFTFTTTTKRQRRVKSMGNNLPSFHYLKITAFILFFRYIVVKL